MKTNSAGGLYPACPLTDEYPILRRVPPEDRAAYVRQAEAGEAPSAEQSAALGLHPSIVGGVLVPAKGALTKAAALCAFKGGERAVRRLEQALRAQAKEVLPADEAKSE